MLVLRSLSRIRACPYMKRAGPGHVRAGAENRGPGRLGLPGPAIRPGAAAAGRAGRTVRAASSAAARRLGVGRRRARPLPTRVRRGRRARRRRRARRTAGSPAARRRCRDHEVDLVGVAVGVDDADDGNLQLARLVDGDLLLAGVDDEEGVGQPAHVADAVEVLLELALLLLEPGDLLLRQRLVAAVGGHGLEVAQPPEAALDRREVGEQPAEPALVDVEHAAALRLFGDGVLRLALGADEEERRPRRRVAGRTARPRGTACGLAEVDDVDAVALAEDVRLHLRVPALRLVAEVDACFEQVLHRERGQASSPLPVLFSAC
jgi:hypothetical protein